MTRAEMDVIAERIADDLFVDAAGEEADRLVLWIDADERNLGGWCKRAVADRVRAVLKGAMLPRQIRRAYQPRSIAPRTRALPRKAIAS